MYYDYDYENIKNFTCDSEAYYGVLTKTNKKPSQYGIIDINPYHYEDSHGCDRVDVELEFRTHEDMEAFEEIFHEIGW